MKRRGLLIFDLDGTLFHTETVTIPAVEQAFGDRGLSPPPAEEIRPFFGRATREFNRWVRSRVPAVLGDEVASAVTRLELELLAKTGELYPGVREVLSTLRGQVREMAICSNGTKDYVPRVIEVQGLGGLFDRVVFRGDSDLDKPQMVRGILERLGGRPAVVIGDRRDDIEAAHRNGLRAIAALYGYGTPLELREADATAASPARLLELIPRFLAVGASGGKDPVV